MVSIYLHLRLSRNSSSSYELCVMIHYSSFDTVRLNFPPLQEIHIVNWNQRVFKTFVFYNYRAQTCIVMQERS